MMIFFSHDVLTDKTSCRNNINPSLDHSTDRFYSPRTRDLFRTADKITYQNLLINLLRGLLNVGQQSSVS